MDTRLDNLMTAIGEKQYIDALQSRELFALNNLYFPQLKEHNPGCDACRKRVYLRMRAEWDKQK